MDVGSLIYKVGVDDSGLVGGLTSAMGTITKTVAVGIGAMTTAASAAVSALAVKSVQAFGEMEQNLGGTEAVFGKFAENVQKQADQAYKNMGLSATEYMATANKMGSLFQGSGIEQARSLELTSAAMQRAADVASVMGLETSAAMEAIAGAAKGNFTMMDNLGVAINATTLDAYAASKGMENFWKNASNSEKAELAIQLFMERTSQYAGNFARESEQTISGSIGMLKSAVADMVANFSNAEADIVGSAGRVADSFVVSIQNIVPAVKTFASNLPKAIAGFMSAAPEIIAEFKNGASEIVDAFMQSMQEQFGGGGGLGAAAGVIDSVKGFALNVIMKAASTVSDYAPQILDALSTSLTRGLSRMSQLVQTGIDIVNKLIQGIGEALPSLLNAAITAIGGFLNTITENLPAVLSAGTNLLYSLVNGVIEALPTLVDTALSVITNFVNVILENLPEIVKTGMNLLIALVRGIMDEMPKIVAAAGDIVCNLIDTIIKMLPDIIIAGADMLAAILEDLPNFLVEVGEAALRVIETLFNGLIGGDEDMNNAGRYLGDVLMDGFSDALFGGMTRVSNVINDFFGGIWAAMQDVAAMIGGDFTSPNSRAFLDGKTEIGSRDFGKIGAPPKITVKSSSTSTSAPGLWEVLNGTPYAPSLNDVINGTPKTSTPSKKLTLNDVINGTKSTSGGLDPSVTTPSFIAPTYTAPDFSSLSASIANDAAAKAIKTASAVDLKPVGTGYGTVQESAVVSVLSDGLSNMERLLNRLIKNTSGSIHSVVRLDGSIIGSETVRFNDELSAATGIGG